LSVETFGVSHGPREQRMTSVLREGKGTTG
jgi:hypothetical protein